MKVLRSIGILLILVVFTASFYAAVPTSPESQNPDPKPDQSAHDSLLTTTASSKPTFDFANMSEWIEKARGDGAFIELVIGLDYNSLDYSGLLEVIAERGGEVKKTIAMKGREEAMVVRVPLEEAFYFASQASELSRYVEPNFKFQSAYVPNDPSWSLQWGPAKIQADYAWNTTTGDKSVLVAVIDTGIDWTHPDLAANYVPLGYDWVNDDSDPKDDYGHGTHVAGIIGAVLNNSAGIAGLAQVQVMAEKALDAYGYGYEDDLANAIIHAVDQGADILSNSWGSQTDSQLIHDAFKYAYEGDVLIIAAAGNTGNSQIIYPASYPEVIAVAATDQSDKRAGFSTFGDWMELAAPGVDIYSTVLSGSYENKSGTSMAAPHVSGVAALVWSRFPSLTRDQVRLHLRDTADDLGSAGFDAYFGYGRVNARRAVETNLPDHELMLFELEKPPYVEPESVGYINATVFNYGNSSEAGVTVQLLVNGTLVDTVTIEVLESGAKVIANFSWSPTEIGTHNVTSYVLPLPGEADVENNRVSAYIHVGFPLRAAVLDSAGTDYDTTVWEDLNADWKKFGGQMIYVDYNTLNKENITYSDLVSSRAQVLIISNAFFWEFTDSEVEAITRFVFEGHGLIATSGTFHYMVPNNNKLAPLFGLNDTIGWDVAFTDLLHLSQPTHPLLVDVPDPYVFRDVGGTVPEDGRWDSNELAGGAYMGLGHYEESAIVVNKGLVYISPWLEVIPSYYRFHLQLFYNAIVWSRYEKPEHELTVALTAPPALNPGESVSLSATVFNMGLNNETDVELRLLINDTLASSEVIPQLSNGSAHSFSYLWAPTVEGYYNVTAFAVPVVGEENLDNNRREVSVPVYELVFALFENVDPWGFQANENALNSLGIPYLVFGSKAFGSFSLEAFAKVVIASDQDQGFYNAVEQYRWWFEDYVNKTGGTLEVHAADGGLNRGRWASRLPGNLTWLRVVSDFASISDPLHPVVNTPNPVNDTELDDWYWTSHGYFTGYPNNTVVVIREGLRGAPAYLEFRFGLGVVLASSLTLEWAYGKGYSLILENSLVYIKPQHELMVTLEAPSFVKLGDSALLNVTVHNRGLNAETDVALSLFINGTLANSTVVSELLGDSLFRFSHLWTPVESGTYNITAYVLPVLGEVDVANNVSVGSCYVRSGVPGDVDGDGHVDYWDVYLFLRAFGSVVGDPEYDERADFNGDGRINYQDVYILLVNYGT